MEKIFEKEYAGHKLRFAFRPPSARLFFDAALKPGWGEPDIKASKERIQRAKSQLPALSKIGYVENQTLIGLAGRALLPHGCCVFHAVAFAWKGKAWLLSAPSGTGKSTQYFNWQRQFPGEIEMICGDMPVLELREQGEVWVHPSNWNGKEGLGGHPAARLGGLVLLEQGRDNRMDHVPAREAIYPVFRQFVADLDDREDILRLSGLMEGLLRSAPVWKLVNLGDDASTRLLRRTLSVALDPGCGNAARPVIGVLFRCTCHEEALVNMEES